MATITNQHHQSITLRRNPILFEQRDVQRAGWLKYIPFAEKYSSSDSHKFWVVFAIYGSQTPYLEFYQQQKQHNSFQSNQQSNNNQSKIIDGPVSKHSLLNCRHIQTVIEYDNNNEKHNQFSIILSTHVIRLAADTEEIMYDWMHTLRTKLIEMNIMESSENVYSKSPQLSRRLINVESNNNTQSTEQELYEPIFNITNEMQQLSLNNSNHSNISNNQLLIISDDEGPPPYECIFANNNNNNSPTSLTNRSQQNNDNLTIINNPRQSFREQQVEKLRNEQSLNFLRLQVRKKDCLNTIAFIYIEQFNGIFIAGWKQQQHPHLHNTFHIGDQLLQINGQCIESTQQIKQIIKQSNTITNNLDFLIRRLPYGKIFCLKRSYDYEDLGIVRDKGTALILNIRDNSIAKNNGLNPYCDYLVNNNNDINRYFNQLEFNNNNNNHVHDRNSYITEINNRPLNLFYKNNEIEKRLNAIGKEISILIQPYGFIKLLKQKFKLIKNYKDYIVQ